MDLSSVDGEDEGSCCREEAVEEEEEEEEEEEKNITSWNVVLQFCCESEA
jgi:hypothetical protein